MEKIFTSMRDLKVLETMEDPINGSLNIVTTKKSMIHYKLFQTIKDIVQITTTSWILITSISLEQPPPGVSHVKRQKSQGHNSQTQLRLSINRPRRQQFRHHTHCPSFLHPSQDWLSFWLLSICTRRSTMSTRWSSGLSSPFSCAWWYVWF